MKNEKGFVLTETLVVTVFFFFIFTFVYVSIVPLMGKYEDLIDRERDVDIIYKLNSIRKLLIEQADESAVQKNGFNDNITCDIFTDSGYRTYCTKLFEQMDITKYRLIYVDDIHTNLENGNIESVDSAIGSDEFSKYLKRYEKDDGEYLVILDMSRDSYTEKERHTMAHLMFTPFIQAH